MFVSETALDRSRNGGANIPLGERLDRSEDAKKISFGCDVGEVRLIGHYIEDDALDALALTGMLSGEAAISLTTSTSLNDLEDWIEGSDLDFVLVDIYRPDSRSFEDEVKRIRAHSNASIFFITGDEAKFYVDDALEVGAEGVLEKEALTANGLIEVLSKAVKSQEMHSNRGGFIANDSATLSDNDSPIKAKNSTENCAQSNAGDRGEWPVLPGQQAVKSVDPKRFEDAQIYLNKALIAVADCSPKARADGEIFRAIADAQILLMAFAQNRLDCAEVQTRSAPRAMRNLQRAALSLAKQRGIKLAFQTTASVFDDTAMSRANICIRSLLKAVLIGSQKGETIKFNGLGNADGIRLSINSTGIFPFDIDDVLKKNLPNSENRIASTILMTALCMLLDLDYSRVTVFRRKNLHTILIDIQDS